MGSVAVSHWSNSDSVLLSTSFIAMHAAVWYQTKHTQWYVHDSPNINCAPDEAWYGQNCLEMVWFVDCSYKQDAPSIVIINMIFAGSSGQSPVWVNHKIVVPSRQNCLFLHLHSIPLIKKGIGIPKGCTRSQSQLESSKNESAVLFSMLHSEGEEHVTTPTSVLLGTACRRIS